MNRQHKGQKKKDKQRSTKHAHKTKDRVTRISVILFILFLGQIPKDHVKGNF